MSHESDRICVVYTDVDVTTPSQDNPFFNRDEIAIRGVIFDPDFHEPRPVRIPSGATIKAYLFIGTDVIVSDPNCCGIRTSKDRINPSIPFESFPKSIRKSGKDDKREFVKDGVVMETAMDGRFVPSRIVGFKVGLQSRTEFWITSFKWHALM